MSRKNRGVKFAASLRKREQYRGHGGHFRRKIRPCQVEKTAVQGTRWTRQEKGPALPGRKQLYWGHGGHFSRKVRPCEVENSCTANMVDTSGEGSNPAR